MEHRLQCRTCLVDAGDLFEVYGETGMELSLPQKMHDHLRITVRIMPFFTTKPGPRITQTAHSQIDQTDAYALMCSKCIGMLNEFHDMYMLVNIAQSRSSFLNHPLTILVLSPAGSGGPSTVPPTIRQQGVTAEE